MVHQPRGVLAEGLLQLERHSPSQETSLVAPTAMLAARSELHPAVAVVLLEAARRIHQEGDALSLPGEFPSSKYVDLPLCQSAESYFRHGPPMMQRLLPFWLAAFIDRVKLLLVPLAMLAMPIIRAAPPLIRWRTRRKIYLWYAKLKELDDLAIEGMTSEQVQSSQREIKSLESQIARVEIPLSYMDEYYDLRSHLNLVQQRIAGLSEAG